MSLVVDTGVLLAALDRDDAHHEPCRELLDRAREPRVVPAPVLVEVDYFVHQRLAPTALIHLLDQVEAQALFIEDLTPEDYRRVREVCAQYADSAVGFVDAAVLAIVERLREPKVATLDERHFRMLRPRHVAALELVPGR